MRAPGVERGKVSYGGSDNLDGLRAGKQTREVGILTVGKFGMQEPVGAALDATALHIVKKKGRVWTRPIQPLPAVATAVSAAATATIAAAEA